MSKIYFTADWHADEVPENVPSMVATHSYLRTDRTDNLIQEWIADCHRIIKPEDTFIFVGDLGITLESYEVYKQLPPCKKILIKGDKEYSGKLFPEEDVDQRLQDLAIFDEICMEKVVEIQGKKYFITHEPLKCFDANMPAICGHVHGVWRTQKMPNGHAIINVGIDAWYGLVSDDFIAHQQGAVEHGYYDIHCQVDQWNHYQENKSKVG